ncbi:MAG: DUF11 domain-containing protein [Gammaproteobacteria bacterium]|jgi:uncharacterized repeat protein (TIGR01451 family)/fimbrial isopeptide formation D2 family protein|nr:DUF11 domain-containing protein [Gammaproteobacteria bacterium]
MAQTRLHFSNRLVNLRRVGVRLLMVLGLLVSSMAAQAQNCSDYPNGILDGAAGDIAPAQLFIDRTCTIRNYPAGNELGTNFSFLTQPGQSDDRWLVIFDNVVHTGQMACNAVAGHKIWFTNGSSTSIQDGCQNLLIPVEKIDKRNPAGTTTAAIGVPFTYTLTIPVLFDPNLDVNTVIDWTGSVNDLHSIVLTDDLNSTGVDLTYLGHTVTWEDSGAGVSHAFSNVGGLLTFTLDSDLIIPATEQIVIELTVVLEDTPVNAPGTQFVNTSKWSFGRFIEDTFYAPLPGEWGITEPLTIAAPELIMTKTGPATLGRTLNLGEWGTFGLDVHNTGLSDAWDITLIDILPDGATGGMCDATPEILSAQIFAADGVTAIPGKGPLNEGLDYTLNYTGVPSCTLTMSMLTAQATIGADERLVISYRTQLDSDSQDGAALTNIAGVTQWYNGDSSNLDRIGYSRTVVTGSPGILDHEDAHTTNVALFGYFFEKSVENRTTGDYPATLAAPGDILRYTLRLQTTDGALADFSFTDDLGAMNATAVFVSGSLNVLPNTVPVGAANNSDAFGGTNSAGLLNISGMNLPANSEVMIQFDIELESGLLDGTVVTNQADLVGAAKLADSDDPFVNGQSDPSIDGDEDPTRVVIEGEPPPPPLKENTQATATIGEQFSYRVTVPSVPHSADLYDVQILDDLATSAADLEFVDVTKISGSGAWTPVNTGTATSLVIEDPAIGIDIPSGEQAVIEITVRLRDTATNIAGLQFTNTALFTYNQLDNDIATQLTGESSTTAAMTVVEPDLTMTKSGPLQMRVAVPETFTLDVHNAGESPAYNLTISDLLPNEADGGMCDVAPSQITAQVFGSDGVTPVSAVLVDGTDYTAVFAGDPTCSLTLTLLNSASAIGVDEHLIVTYQTELDADSVETAALTNIAGATEWFSLDVEDAAALAYARDYDRVLTDGTINDVDHEDAHTILVFTPTLIFEKYAVNLTTSEDPATVATPGDLIEYTLRIENAGTSPIDGFDVIDELDNLNATGMFQAGTLTVTDASNGTDNSDANGGASGTGLLSISDLSIGGLGETLFIVFEVQLAPVIANDTVVLNQSEATFNGYPIALSDDPNINGAADPDVAGDEDPTEILIQSAPSFIVEKISTYLDGDPNVLLAGETLRYTITVQNTGTANATDAYIVDQIPANTTYVSDSTMLNGVPVPDGASSALIDGIQINAPEDTTPGVLNAGVANNVATITFDVIVNADVPDGTVISNQAFVSAVDYGIADQPSDDPRTELVDDPTRDVVGNFPLLFATKSAQLQVDNGSPDIVDPDDTLRYTITIYNNGNVPATIVELFDDVPANTSYVADSTTLNGAPIGQPDGGVFPLAARIDVSSADLALPGSGEGVLSPGESAVVQFDLLVDSAAVRGSLIVNQATVYSAEVANLLTDGDGNPATGPEPTIVVVGDAQALTIVKEVSVVDGGTAIAGATLEYVVTVQNVGTVPAQYVTIRDDLDETNPDYLTYVDQSATLNGLATGVSFADPVISADYFSNYGALAPGEFAVLRFRAIIDPALAEGTPIVNTARVYWDDPQQQAEATVMIDVGAMPDAGMLSGNVWHDADHENTLGGFERPLEGWLVELLLDDQPVRSMVTDADGYYLFTNVIPNYATGSMYSLRFSAPGAVSTTAMLGVADSDFTDGQQEITEIDVQEGSNLLALNLPVDPNGVIYASVGRSPVSGAVVTLVDPRNNLALPATCFDDPNQQGQVTVSNGYYKFDINFSDPACPSGSNYVIQVTAPDASFVPGVSVLIPPSSDQTTLPFDVPSCPGSANDAVLGILQTCEAQASEFAPPSSVPAQSPATNYHLFLRLDATQAPGSSQLFNNHVPLDPRLDGAVAITKTTPMLNVTRGQLVPYIITVSNSFGVDLQDVNIIDRFPAGFRYIEGSARFDNEPLEPTIVGRELIWSNFTLAVDGRHTIKLLLAAGAGVTEGEFVNRAQATNSILGSAISEEASATVRIIPDPTFDCTDVTGKVFNDANRNGYQDNDEDGLSGVRLVTAKGLVASTDAHGRYHITCAVVPNESRGSNFVLKLDDRTLPSGFRSSTRPVQVQRATRGKSLRINFGASIHRVVGLDIADAVFEPNSSTMRQQWIPRVSMLLEELQKAPAILRLSYVADIEPEALVEQRLKSLKSEISDAWEELNCCYELVIEPEIHWRLGGPVAQSRGGEQ